MSDQERIDRAKARASWPIVRTRLDEDPSDLLPDVPAGERVAMVWALTVDAWAMRGEPIPDYPRAQAPGRVLRTKEP